ncbi:ABC transporter permease [Paenibacillus eucommiae]|uniref:ABC-type polysaccharide transport system permease subunit n=1 Tax=Paenibacillus eucommiae TaxID=1355755 RepID=A0ABS4J3S9_9BACL|nr:ABC transporter permease subunit [Paenibacillus eucommiae]MBP1993871.1 ABC-type polysaccharide transport system permease subunit [Paenibacillus eucommiae]
MHLQQAVTVKLKPKTKISWRRLSLFILVLPFLAMVFIFSYVPLFGWVYAFFDYKPGIALSETPFAGFKYFRLLLNGEIGNVLLNTLAISFLNILTSPLPIIFAILLMEIRGRRFKKIVQTLTTLPHFISWIIIFSLVFSIFSFEGIFNTMLMKFGLIQDPVNILGDPAIAWYVQTAIVIWKHTGWYAIIYLAAITSIDTQLYDAAKIDGAGRFRCIWHVTLPGLMPTYVVLLLLSVSSMLSNGFDQFFVFYNPMVADKLEVLDYYIYRIAFHGNDYPLATAAGMGKTLISIILLFSVNFLAKRLRGQSII